MVPPGSFVSPTWQLEESVSDVDSVASTSVFHNFTSPSHLGLGSHYSGTSPYSTPVSQENFDPVGMQDSSAFLTSSLSFESNIPVVAPIPLDLTQGCIPRVFPGLEYVPGFTFDGDPATNNNSQINDEVPWCSVSLSFGPLDLNPENSPFGQDMEDNFQLTAGPYSSPLEGNMLPSWRFDQPEAHKNSPTFNFADLVAGIDGLSYSLENIQMVDLDAEQSPPYTASPPLEQRLILSGGLVFPCEWREEDGTMCGEALTRASLPGHLSKHGIEKKPRDDPTTCRWVGCKRKKPINRESIVRHIREVHLGLSRPSKRVQESKP